MTKENIKTNTSLRYSQYQKRLLHTFSFEKLKKQIEMLHDQEFIIKMCIRERRHAQIRSKRTDVKTHRRGYREATVEKKLKFGSAESMEGVKHAETVKKSEQKRHFYNRFFQKKRYKDAYRAARAGKSAGSLGGATTITGCLLYTSRHRMAIWLQKMWNSK